MPSQVMNIQSHYPLLSLGNSTNGLYVAAAHVGICTDGAKTMTGRHSGVATHVQAVAPNTTFVHCSIHREALAVKGMPDCLKNILDTTVKMVNFVNIFLWADGTVASHLANIQ